jgi:hypothetical protein
MYAGRVTTRGNARWAGAFAVGLLTAPGVLVAQLLVTGVVPGPRSVLLVCAVVCAVVCAIPARSVAGTAVLAAGAQLAGHGVLAFAAPQVQARQGCLSVVSHGADLGVRYALVRSDACPPGSLSATPPVTAVISAVAAAALVLLGHALLATLTGVLATVIAAGVEIVRRLADAVRPVLTLLLDVRVLPADLPAPALPEPLPLTDRRQPGTVLRRGPPVAFAAV